MKKRVISVINYLFFLLIGILFLWLAFRKADLQNVWQEIINANYWFILLAIISALLSHIVRAMRWNLLINSLGYKTRISTTFYAVMIGYLANAAVPRLGEVSRCGVLSRKDKIPFNELFGSVVAERIFDMIILLFIIFLVIILQFKLVGGFVRAVILDPLIDGANSNKLLLFFILAGVIVVILSGIYLLKKNKERIKRLSFYEKLRGFIFGFWEGFKTIKRSDKKLLFLFHTLLIWVLYSLMVYFPFFAIDETSHLTFIDAVTAMAIGSLGIVAPVPGGIGTYHFFMKATLTTLYAVGHAAAASFAAITHAAQVLMILVVGSYSFLMIVVQKKKMANGNARFYQVQDTGR